VSNEGFRSIATGLPNLQSLFIKSSNAVSDEGIRWISTLKQLQKLSIYFLDKITDEALKHIGDGLTQLQSLEIVECKKLSDAGLQHLIGLRNLESLDIWRCEHISRQALFIVATLLPKVQMDDSDDDDDDESVRDLPPVQISRGGGAMRVHYYSDNSDDSADEML
jgi:N-dimethylarginine dimethylaminohydrolase